jgi:prevent-host-death family protein
MKTRSITVGAFEAKTKLGELLERVGQGAEFTITKHDRPVARLVGFKPDSAAQRVKAAAELRASRARYNLGGLNVRRMREEGRA